MHAVNRLFEYRKSLSTTEYKSRGYRLKRCGECRLNEEHCTCAYLPNVKSPVSFLILMYDTEVMKPSNTGRLIADVIPDTHAFLWSRTVKNNALLDIIQNEKYQPVVVFPKDYADDGHVVIEQKMEVKPNKTPLFIMLDGSWREAKKMFRKSPYLKGLPIFSFSPAALDNSETNSRYHIRKAANDTQLATAEVAARVLEINGDSTNGQLLDHWFDVFSYQYQRTLCRENKGDAKALQSYLDFVKEHDISIGSA